MSLDKYLVPGRKANICFDCEHYAKDCSWTETNLETMKTRFEPVPGWTAEKVKLNLGSNKKGPQYADTYCITDCPNFQKTPFRYSDPRELGDDEIVL